MLRLLTPVWLLGLAALAVPVLLHLWSRRPTKVVALGSLRHLAGPPGPRALGRRLEDLPLLLLRAGVITAVVLGLAGLATIGTGQPATPRTVLLVDPDALSDSLAVFHLPVVDSARRAGDPIRLLAPGFPTIGEPVARKVAGSSWALLAELADTLPDGSRILVAGTPSAGDLGAHRPELRSSVEFMAIRSGSGAWSARSGERPVETDQLADRPVTGYRLQIIADEDLGFASQAASAAWTAAVEAVQGQLLEDASDTLRANQSRSVIIWLTGQSVSDDAISRTRSGGVLVEFPTGEPLPTTLGQVVPMSTALPQGLLNAGIRLRAAMAAGSIILVDDSAQPMMSVERLGQGWHYRVATRPEAEWSDLATSGDLVELALLTLRRDATGWHAAPVHPVQSAARPRAVGTRRGEDWQSLMRAMLLVAALLLVAERLVSYRRTAGAPA